MRTAVQQSPAFADAHALATRLAVATGAQRGRAWRDYTSASAEANRDALRHAPGSADAWNNLGWSLAQLGFRAEAAQAYRASLALRPNDERTRNNLKLVQ